jgi:phage terminase small subunit
MSHKRLNSQQAEFFRLVSTGMRGTDAYRAVYPGDYSQCSCQVKASRLLKHPLIAAARARQMQAAVLVVDEVVSRYAISAERIADAMARLAFTDLRQIVDVKVVAENGKRRQIVEVRNSDDIDPDAHPAIAELKRTAGGEITVKLFNKREALMDLARLKGWIAEKQVSPQQLVMLKIER